jgi:hypothetical protein
MTIPEGFSCFPQKYQVLEIPIVANALLPLGAKLKINTYKTLASDLLRDLALNLSEEPSNARQEIKFEEIRLESIAESKTLDA